MTYSECNKNCVTYKRYGVANNAVTWAVKMSAMLVMCIYVGFNVLSWNISSDVAAFFTFVAWAATGSVGLGLIITPLRCMWANAEKAAASSERSKEKGGFMSRMRFEKESHGKKKAVWPYFSDLCTGIALTAFTLGVVAMGGVTVALVPSFSTALLVVGIVMAVMACFYRIPWFKLDKDVRADGR